MSQYPHLIQRVFDTPLMILESKLQTILTVLAPRAEFRVELPGSLDVPGRDSLEASLQGMGHRVRRSRNGYLMVGTTAVLDVMGTLVQRCSGMDAASGLCSYEFLAADVARIGADDEVSSVLMVLDTPGGEATSGLFDLADQIAALRSEKPVYAYAHDLAASAGYLLHRRRPRCGSRRRVPSAPSASSPPIWTCRRRLPRRALRSPTSTLAATRSTGIPSNHFPIG